MQVAAAAAALTSVLAPAVLAALAAMDLPSCGRGDVTQKRFSTSCGFARSAARAESRINSILKSPLK
jgi:hypothetical protein